MSTFDPPKQEPPQQSRLLALAMYIFVPGLGHLYMGWLRWAIAFALIVPLTNLVMAMGLLVGGTMGLLMVAGGAVVRFLGFLGGLAQLAFTGTGRDDQGFQTLKHYVAWSAVAWGIAIGASAGVRAGVVEPYRIPSGSMYPTLEIGDHIVVRKGLALGHVRRGDIVVFAYPLNEQQNYIKRVIGLPGDEVRVVSGVPFINGEPTAQTFEGRVNWADTSCRDHQLKRYTETFDGRSWKVAASMHRGSLRNMDAVTVPPDHYFVMGDNRDNALDSRVWGFVRHDQLHGRAQHIWLSWDGCAGEVRADRPGMTVKPGPAQSAGEQVPNAAEDAAETPAPVVDPEPAAVAASFEAVSFDLKCLRSCSLTLGELRVPVPLQWFSMGGAAPEDILLRASDFDQTTTLALGDGRYLVHAFAYGIAEGGSMGLAEGMDVFMLVDGDDVKRVVSEGGPTMRRVRGGTEWGSSETWLVADVDGDGQWDIGDIHEGALNEGGDFTLHQEPVRWHLAASDFVSSEAHMGELPEHAVEVPRPSIGKTSTEYVMSRGSDGPWQTDGTVVWNPPPRAFDHAELPPGR